MAFITDLDLKTRLLDCLQKAELDTEGAWETIATDANRKAYGEIVTALAVRGYTGAQIRAWDRRQEFNLDLGIFWALTAAGTTKQWDQKFIDKFDRRKELATIAITIDGDLVLGASETDSIKGRVKIGQLKADNDVFSMDFKT